MLQLILEYRSDAQLITILIVTILSIWKGGGPERAIGVVILGMALITTLHYQVLGGNVTLGTVDVFSATVDGMVAIALIAIALRANRMYPLCIAGLQIIALGAHLAREMVEAMTPIAYAILFILPSYFQILVLGAGLWLHRRRVARYGPYRDWRADFAGPTNNHRGQ